MRAAVQPPVWTRRGLLRLIGGVGLGSACSRPARDPIQRLLDELAAAAEDRDAQRLAARLAASFEGPQGMRRAEAIGTLKRYFAAYESVGVSVYGVESERGEGSTRLRCVVDFSGRARKLAGLEGLLPPSATYRFDLQVGEEAGALKVSRARWEAVEGPAEP